MHSHLLRCGAFVIAILAGCASPPPSDAFIGDPAPVSAATQTILIKPDTRWVNVTGGDVVKFIANGKEFAWSFNVGAGTTNFELNRVAPPGALDHKVVAYVAPDPKYIGGGDGRGDK